MPNILTLLNELASSPVWKSPAMKYAVIIVPTIAGLIYCFYGYRLARVISALVGASIGGGIGFVVAGVMKMTPPLLYVIPAVGAILFGILGYFLVRLGIFLIVFLVIFGSVGVSLEELTSLDRVVVLIVSLVSGLILGILSAIYDKVLIIIATSIGGAMIVADRVFDHLVHIRWDASLESYIRLGFGVFLAVVGLIFQFVTTRDMKSRYDDEEGDYYDE